MLQCRVQRGLHQCTNFGNHSRNINWVRNLRSHTFLRPVGAAPRHDGWAVELVQKPVLQALTWLGSSLPWHGRIAPAFFLSPFGFGYGYGFGGGGVISLVFWGILATFLFQAARRALGNANNDDDDQEGYYETAERFSVAKVQVGLLGSARELQSDLERIARRADTTTPSGLHYVLQETVLSLMRNPQYCIYGYSKSGSERGLERAESRFNQLSIEERGKFEKETMVNVGGRSQRSSLGKPYGVSGLDELIVVTILVAAACPLKLPSATSGAGLKAALAKLGSVRASDIVAVEVLWTPEEEGDFFSEDDLVADYPRMNRLM